MFSASELKVGLMYIGREERNHEWLSRLISLVNGMLMIGQAKKFRSVSNEVSLYDVVQPAWPSHGQRRCMREAANIIV